jgi:class 3 adenylate cyclase/predicted ATPase
MTCANCGTQNQSTAKFCLECGTVLSASCPSCGASVPPGAKFCPECGSAIGTASSRVAATSSAPPPASPRDLPSAERRLVSILFADLVGFTTLSESRDAEEVRDLLTRYFDTCRTLITRYGGTIEKFIGDAVMAVWGTPVATEDDAARAVRAALDLTKAVADLGAEVGAPDLRARAGVLTGEAAVNLRAEGQGMVAGDLVNTASRIQSAAEPGAVFVGEVTRRATEAAVVYEDAGSHELKGKAEAIPLWRAVRVVAGARGGLKSSGLEAPFVGRDRELRTVKELFFATSEDRKSHLLSITGIAGIGKSRLSWEFYKYFDGLPQLTYYHRGRCLAYGEGVAYWALADMVRMRARIAEAEPQDSALAKLHTVLEERIPDHEERKWIEPRLAHLLGLEERTAPDREDLFAAWRLFFERLAEENPTVLVFEDMQWADASLVDFIEYLLEWSRNFPIFVLTLARPEFLERHPTWGAGKRNFTSLYLEPLPPEAMDGLLHGLVPGLPSDLAAQILDRAQGIPLYAVETVRMLLDRGLLAQEGSVYVPTGPIDSLEVPQTLHALIAARLDGLSPEERRLVQDAAVLGKTFFTGGLAAVSGIPEPDLLPLLTSLVKKEVLSLQSDPRSPERGQYGFLQDLLKTVAYETLSNKERKAKHLRATAFITSTWSGEEEEIVEVLASHFMAAYKADPNGSDAAEIKARARDMLARAGERAASLAAAGEAQRYFEQALELAAESLERAELHERAGRMAWTGVHAAEARSHFERAIALFDSIGLLHMSARVSARLGEIDFSAGNLEEAIERMERALEVLSAEEPDEGLAALASELARVLFFAGRLDAAMERIELALQVAEALHLQEVVAHALNTKGLILQARGRLQEAGGLLHLALEIALANDLSSAALRSYNNLSAFASYGDRHAEGLEFALAGLELSRKVGARVNELRFLSGVATPLIYLGRWEEALARAEEIRRIDDLDALQGVMLELLATAPALAHQGRFDEATQMLAILPNGETSEDLQTRASYLAAQAGTLRAMGRYSEALTAAEGATALRGELGIYQQAVKEALVETIEAAFALGDLTKVESTMQVIDALRPGELTPYLQAQGARLGARVSAARGEDERVQPGFLAAADLFRQLSMPFLLAVTLLEHGEWLDSKGRADDAEPLLAEAREIFERLRAKPWLERLDSIRRSRASAAVGVGDARS